MPIVRPLTIDLFAGVGDLINTHLGVMDYRTKTAALMLVAQASGTLDGEDLVQALFELLRQNWLRALPTAKASRQNFRWRIPQLTIADRNTSPEVTLERALIRAAVDAGRADWSNQVPVVSGIAGARAYKRQAVDLIHRLPHGGFEFVELKIASNTPLFATIEVLLYGSFWLLSRQSKTLLGYLANPILDTPALQLSTLAPVSFYAGLTSTGFADAIDQGVRALGLRHGVVMGFRQMAFPQGFHWPALTGDRELLNWLDHREPIPPCA
jgi:hypothetical protein